MIRTNWPKIAGITVLILFAFLLLIRLDWLQLPGQPSPVQHLSKSEKAEASDIWMQVMQHGRKIGYAHRILTPQENGYGFADELFMRINTMGVIQGLSFSTQGTLNPDMTLATFHVHLASNMFRFEAKGKIVGKTLTVLVRDNSRGEESRYEILLKEPPSTSGNIAERMFRSGLKKGETKTFHIFDAASMGVRPVKATVLGEEDMRMGNTSRRLTKISVEFLGTRQHAWLDREGHLVREEGLLGLSLERVEEAEAKTGLDADTAKGIDMTELASIASNKPIQEPQKLTVLKMRLLGIEDRRFALSGGRQLYQNGVLTIRKEFLAGEEAKRDPAKENLADHLRPSPFIQSDHPDIIDALKGIVAPNDGPGAKSKKIVHWVYHHLEKQPVLSVSNAVETLKQRRGDCTEHAVLVAALARAAGIPATIETGLVYQRGRFYYHAWNVFWLGEGKGWMTADAVFNQIPADVTHIRFVRGEMQEQLDLIGLIGRLQVEIIQ